MKTFTKKHLWIFTTLAVVCGFGIAWADEKVLVSLDFESEATNPSARQACGAELKGVRVLGKGLHPDGMVDASVVLGGSPLGGGEKSLLVLDASRKGPRQDAVISFTPQKESPLVVGFDLRVNRVSTAGDIFVLRVFDDLASQAGIRLGGDGKTPVLTDGDGKQVSKALTLGRWYRIRMILPPAQGKSGNWRLSVSEGGPVEGEESLVFLKRDGKTSAGYGRLTWNSGFGPDAEADLNIDNIRIATIDLADFAPAQGAAPTLPGPMVETKSENIQRLPLLNWEKRSDWQSVKTDFDRNAVGDGKADDTPALQMALDSLSDGTTLYFPAGTYRITKGLELRVPPGGLSSVRLVGHGRATRIIWDGEKDGRMLTIRGLHRSRFTGIVWDGRGIAGVGVTHDAIRFETQLTHEHEAFLSFTTSGLQIAPKHKEASAELLYQGCLFEDCEKGLSFYSFNDYDNTIDGCEFYRCGIAIEDLHGNFYARNTRFEESRVVDIRTQSEHSSSVRRCVSLNSRQFVDHRGSVSPITVDNCTVVGWKSEEGAVRAAGAPLTIFDTAFKMGPVNKAPVFIARKGQRVLLSANEINGPMVHNPGEGRLYEIPAGKIPQCRPALTETFLGNRGPMPGKILDVKRDFGAKGDGVADDTESIQRAIDTGNQLGNNALVYLPTGKYLISRTLVMKGKDFTVGGSGFKAMLVWKGKAGGTLLAIQDPQSLILENINVGSDDENIGGYDILQTSVIGKSSMTYDMVSVFGLYRKQAGRQGLRLEGLKQGDQVQLRHLQGNLRLANSGAATILARCTYEGVVTVEGKEGRGGLTGFLTRLGTKAVHSLYVRDSQSLVMSDFYIEQADNGFLFAGNPGDVPGRITIQGAKMGTEEGPVTMENFAGEVYLGHHQYYNKPSPMVFQVSSTQPSDLFLMASMFYGTLPSAQTKGQGKVYLFGNHPTALAKGDIEEKEGAADTGEKDTAGRLSRALDDLRRLGAADRALFYGR